MKALSLFACMVLVLLITTGCAASGPTTTTTAKAGSLQVYVTDARPSGVTKVVVKARNIEVHSAGAADDAGWVVVVSDPPAFDLVSVSGISQLLGGKDIAPGKYTQVRLDVPQVNVTLEGGKELAASVPSEKLKLTGEFTIEAGKTTAITLDFDAEKSVVLKGKEEALFKPVVKLLVAKPGEGTPRIETTTTPPPTPTTTSPTTG